MKLKRWQTILAGLIISAAFLFLSLRQANLNAMLEALQTARYQYIVLASLSIIISLILSGTRWSVLTKRRLPVVDTFWLVNIGFLINNVLPARAGEIARAVLAGKRSSIHFSSALSSIVVERLFDMVAVVVLLGIALIALPLPSWAIGAGAFLGAIALTGFVVLVISARKPVFFIKIGTTILILLPWVNKEKAQTFLAPFVEGLGGVADLKTFALSTIWTTTTWLFSSLGAWLMLLAFWESVPLAFGSLTIAAAGIGIAIPAAPSGVGPYEAAIIGVLTAIGYDVNISRSYAITLHATNIAITTILGLVGLTREGVSFGQVAREAMATKPAPELP